MTTTIRLRRGLPRQPQGEPWPPTGLPDIPLDAATTAPVPATALADVESAGHTLRNEHPQAPAPSPTAGQTPVAERPDEVPLAAGPVVAAPAAGQVTLRRGLPRVPGGESWPPESAHPVAATPPVPPAVPASTPPAAVAAPVDTKPQESTRAASPVAATPQGGTTATVQLRRGLPRVAGGEPWPELEEVSVRRAGPADNQPDTVETPVAETTAPVVAPAVAAPAEVTPTEVAPAASPAPEQPAPEARRYGPFTLRQWIGGGVLGTFGIIILAAAVVLGVRWLLGTEAGGNFIAAYPGHAPMPESAPVGFPAWLAWSHFFNVFLMVLIIRSGLQIRSERRPPAYWSPRGGSARKISLTIWFHQSLDLLWVINGVAFLILLFSTGQWMRIVPTSWEVFPNALSAALQYLSLNWPTENGWVHYNGLQQLAYFLTVFIAAPLAVATGVRMSGIWPTKLKRLTALYPVEVARRLHVPVMLYFVFFIISHVLLVFATGALRNLNHMFAAQGSPDPGIYADNWTGFWLFVLSLVMIAAAWVAARPMILAPVAKLFGEVTSR